MHNILSTCIISNLHAEDDGYTVIDLHYVDDVYYTQLNDKPIKVKYKEFTDIKHVDIEFKDDTKQNIITLNAILNFMCFLSSTRWTLSRLSLKT